MREINIWQNAKKTIPPDNEDILGWYRRDGYLESLPRNVWFCSKEEAQKEVEGYCKDFYLAYWTDYPEDGMFHRLDIIERDNQIEQEIFNRFGLIRDITQAKEIAKYFYELGRTTKQNNIL